MRCGFLPAGTLSHVDVDVRSEAGADGDGAQQRVVVVEQLGGPLVGSWWYGSGSTMIGSPWAAHSSTARAHASSVGAVPASSSASRSSTLPPSSPLAASAAAL